MNTALGEVKGATVLVTGASGFIGAPLVRRLAGGGAEVVAVARRPQPPGLPAKVRWRSLDCSAADDVAALFAATRPQIVYHLTSDSQGGRELDLVPASFRNDVQTTVNMLTAAARNGCRRFIMPASLEEPRGEPADTVVPSSPYAAARWVAGAYGRMFAALYGLPVVQLRPFMTYGPGQKDYKVVPYTVLALLRGEAPRLSSGTRPVDWVFIDDIVEAFLAAAGAPGIEGSCIDLGSGTLVTVRDMVLTAAELVGGGIAPSFGAVGDRRMEQVRAAETETARRLLGWAATTPLREGLARTIAWYGQQTEARRAAQNG